MNTPSVQSRLDAEADAETLLRYLESEWCASRLMSGKPDRRLNYGRLRNLRARTLTGMWETREIARAAFRACPELKS